MHAILVCNGMSWIETTLISKCLIDHTLIPIFKVTQILEIVDDHKDNRGYVGGMFTQEIHTWIAKEFLFDFTECSVCNMWTVISPLKSALL